MSQEAVTANRPVVIIGAGLAGLACARVLHAEEIPFQLLEASNGVGGRVRTDLVGGFQLDRGFQVLLTAYPEASAQLDYNELNLGRFQPGALIRAEGRFHRFADPWRAPSQILKTAFSKVGSLKDKLRVAGLRADSRKGDVCEVFEREEYSTAEELNRRGFSDEMIDRFFKPFLGGVFLEPHLKTSNRMLNFVFRMFSEGDAVLPAAGMQAIPDQLAAQLPAEAIRLDCPVARIERQVVHLRDGDRIPFGRLVVATDGQTASRLLSEVPQQPEPHSVCCIYYAAEKPPVEEPVLVLNGDNRGLVNNVAVLDQVAPTYGPPGSSLISVSVLGNPIVGEQELDAIVTDRLGEWFGPIVSQWKRLRTYRISHALPTSPPAYGPRIAPAIGNGVYVCGDFCTNPSIDGALRSGRLTGEALLADL